MSEARDNVAADRDAVVLVLAPLAGDAEVIPARLEEAGMAHRICRDEDELRRAVLPDSTGILFVVATHEAATESVGDILLEADKRQPEWSRLPIVFLVGNVRTPPPGCRNLLQAAGQPPLVLLERPVKPATLNSVFDMQRRTRRRQFENRDLQQQLREAERHKDFLLRELRHRTGNSLAVLQSLFRLTARKHTDVRSFVDDFEKRFSSLVGAYKRLDPDGKAQTLLRTIFTDHVEPYARTAAQLRLEGPDLAINERLGFDLALIVHELATNAAKYGALSVADGWVEVQWQVGAETGALDIVWQERDGPAVTAPSREGLGSALIRQFGTRSGAETDVEYLPTGVRWIARIPKARYELATFAATD